MAGPPLGVPPEVLPEPPHAADAPVVEEDAEEALPSCRCGTNRESKYSVVHREYSFLGTLYLLWGGTSIPSKVSFGA